MIGEHGGAEGVSVRRLHSSRAGEVDEAYSLLQRLWRSLLGQRGGGWRISVTTFGGRLSSPLGIGVLWRCLAFKTPRLAMEHDAEQFTYVVAPNRLVTMLT